MKFDPRPSIARMRPPDELTEPVQSTQLTGLIFFSFAGFVRTRAVERLSCQKLWASKGVGIKTCGHQKRFPYQMLWVSKEVFVSTVVGIKSSFRIKCLGYQKVSKIVGGLPVSPGRR